MNAHSECIIYHTVYMYRYKYSHHELNDSLMKMVAKEICLMGGRDIARSVCYDWLCVTAMLSSYYSIKDMLELVAVAK